LFPEGNSLVSNEALNCVAHLLSELRSCFAGWRQSERSFPQTLICLAACGSRTFSEFRKTLTGTVFESAVVLAVVFALVVTAPTALWVNHCHKSLPSLEGSRHNAPALNFYLHFIFSTSKTSHAAPNNGGMNVPGIKGLRQPFTFRPNLSNATLAALVPAQMDIANPRPTIGIKIGYFPKPFATNNKDENVPNHVSRWLMRSF
jgi:hypothetical protein